MTTSGHFLIGTGMYGQSTQFDNIQLYSRFKDCATATPAVGSPVVMSNCIAEVGAVPHTSWTFNAPANNGTGTWGGLMSVRSAGCVPPRPPRQRLMPAGQRPRDQGGRLGVFVGSLGSHGGHVVALHVVDKHRTPAWLCVRA